MKFGMRSLLVISTVFTCASWAHTMVTKPAHRANENIKTGPCGAAAATNVVATYTAGGMVTVEWSNYIKHKGYFRVAISPKTAPANDNDFVVLENPLAPPATNPYPNYMDPKIHIYNTGDKPNNAWSVNLKIPETMNCARCTLQIIEYMMDSGPNTPPSLYHTCADIEVKAAPTTGTDPGTGNGSGGGNNDGGGGSTGGGNSGSGDAAISPETCAAQ